MMYYIIYINYLKSNLNNLKYISYTSTYSTRKLLYKYVKFILTQFSCYLINKKSISYFKSFLKTHY